MLRRRLRRVDVNRTKHLWIASICCFAMGLYAASASAQEGQTSAPTASTSASTAAAPPTPSAAASASSKPQPTTKPTSAAKVPGEQLYKKLREAARGQGGSALLSKLRSAASAVAWKDAQSRSFVGHVRVLEDVSRSTDNKVFLVRELSGDVFVLAVPNAAALKKGSGTPYADLAAMTKFKLEFDAQVAATTVDSVRYEVVRFSKAPQRVTLDKIFFIAIVLLLFLVMVGMGLTLTLRDFSIVFKKPKGMIVGTLLQFGLLPLIAMALGRAAGFYDAYPFIFLGLILVAASPGGVTSNLMTYLGKGDVALSVSLTAVCTVLSILFTPLLLTLYGSNIPDFSIPVMDVVKQILILVIVPLFIGMLVRSKWERGAKRAEKPFALLGVVALLFLIIVGIWSNLDKFADTERYGVKFYGIIFVLTLLGMLFGGGIAKVVGIRNYQARAIALEVGLRNASLSMTIALLLQDQMGDFASSMFFSSGIFGLWMYFAGAITIFGFKKVLPVDESEIERLKPGEAST